jgi:putative lipoprotein (rSAM/lipoprotein system)
MAKVKRHFFRKYNALITLIISILGFSTACESLDEYGAPAVEYGAPTATFIVKGKVSSNNNNLIPNIRVSMGTDTAYSDASGNYEVRQQYSPTDIEFPIKFEDVDGVENGEFNSVDTVAKFENPTFTGGDGNWDMGETESQLDIKMDDKE